MAGGTHCPVSYLQEIPCSGDLPFHTHVDMRVCCTMTTSDLWIQSWDHDQRYRYAQPYFTALVLSPLQRPDSPVSLWQVCGRYLCCCSSGSAKWPAFTMSKSSISHSAELKGNGCKWARGIKQVERRADMREVNEPYKRYLWLNLRDLPFVYQCPSELENTKNY